ncbi:haloacid dehalogenase type II [Pulveribacter sp.]|uniref:haloacid dehalogenase type II n=1 Tax=Pulveribacter sp. TaxID=2678893 RepID=UPI00289FBA56|nr:haloacid dehalogenase type II [Pulveribacter sp.]
MALPKALAFDVFGTVVDWHGSIAREARTFLSTHLPAMDPGAFALQWRALYQPAMQACRDGGRPFVRLDVLHHEMLLELLQSLGMDAAHCSGDELLHLSRAWRRLTPWPDVPAGLAALREIAPVVTLSNANVALMVAMNRFNGLQWDAIMGAELAQAYKPEPAAYLRTAESLGLEPHELCLVACHHSDLAAARACGLATAYVERPHEYGGAPAPDLSYQQAWDWQADDFPELARQMGHAGAGAPRPGG